MSTAITKSFRTKSSFERVKNVANFLRPTPKLPSTRLQRKIPLVVDLRDELPLWCPPSHQGILHTQKDAFPPEQSDTKSAGKVNPPFVGKFREEGLARSYELQPIPVPPPVVHLVPRVFAAPTPRRAAATEYREITRFIEVFTGRLADETPTLDKGDACVGTSKASEVTFEARTSEEKSTEVLFFKDEDVAVKPSIEDDAKLECELHTNQHGVLSTHQEQHTPCSAPKATGTGSVIISEGMWLSGYTSMDRAVIPTRKVPKMASLVIPTPGTPGLTIVPKTSTKGHPSRAKSPYANESPRRLTKSPACHVAPAGRVTTTSSIIKGSEVGSAKYAHFYNIVKGSIAPADLKSPIQSRSVRHRYHHTPTPSTPCSTAVPSTPKTVSPFTVVSRPSCELKKSANKDIKMRRDVMLEQYAFYDVDWDEDKLSPVSASRVARMTTTHKKHTSIVEKGKGWLHAFRLGRA